MHMHIHCDKHTHTQAQAQAYTTKWTVISEAEVTVFTNGCIKNTEVKSQGGKKNNFLSDKRYLLELLWYIVFIGCEWYGWGINGQVGLASGVKNFFEVFDGGNRAVSNSLKKTVCVKESVARLLGDLETKRERERERDEYIALIIQD